MTLQAACKIRLVTIFYLIIGWVACLSVIFGDMPISLAAEPETPLRSPEAWQVSADRIDYNQAEDAYTAVGNVAISREGRTLTADRAQLNQKTRQANAQGNVRLISGDDVLSGESLLFNLDSETGTLTDGTVFISKSHLYLSGRKINKTGPHTYAAEKVRLTSCDDPDPAWKLTGRDFKVTVEGYGYAKHTALWAGKVPLLYSPFLVFSVKSKRQSGLLTPQIGYSDRKGSEYLQPLYWAINEQSDATFYLHHMSQRGIRSGLEYRYVLKEGTMGALMAEGFTDDRIDDGQDDASSRWGYEDDAQLRINEDRYWFRMKHDHAFDSGLTIKLDLDVVSDQDYLHEFKSGQFGFDYTLSYFESTFGRNLDDYNEPVRLNRLNLNRTWSRYSFNSDLRWNDDVIKRRIADTDDTLHQLPVISFEGIKQPLAGSPLYFDLASSYSNFYRINGTRGHRTDIYPRLYYPTTLLNFLTIEPSAGLRQTAWHIDRYATVPDHGRETLYRAIYDFKLDLSTEFYRIFDFNLAGSDRLKHALTPEIVYAFTPEEDQSDFPVFDDLDRIERQNLITYGFTNTLTARAPQRSENKPTTFNYTPFLRFYLSQSFDINKDREDNPEPFSAISAELDVTPGKYLNLDTDAQWSPYDNEIEVLNAAVRLWDLRGDKLDIDYRYTRETSPGAGNGIETVGLSGELVLSERWLARAGFEFNYIEDEEIERRAGISYQSQCWGVDFDYSIENGNIGYTLMFHLIGLGSFGAG